ncbi:hypothetical protein ABPG74_017130 [Tetrahymena malaccensis]
MLAIQLGMGQGYLYKDEETISNDSKVIAQKILIINKECKKVEIKKINQQKKERLINKQINQLIQYQTKQIESSLARSKFWKKSKELYKTKSNNSYILNSSDTLI